MCPEKFTPVVMNHSGTNLSAVHGWDLTWTTNLAFFPVSAAMRLDGLSRLIWSFMVFSFLCIGCSGSSAEEKATVSNSEPTTPLEGTANESTDEQVEKSSPLVDTETTDESQRVDLDPLRHQPELPNDARTIIFIDGQERVVPREAAIQAGYTIVDFRDDWTPIIFEPRLNEDQELVYNRYSRTFVGLANDKTDGDGRPLPEDELNFLEVFGIPPSTGVMRDRFIDDSEKACLTEIDYQKIGSLEKLTYRNDRKREIIAPS